MTKESVEPKKKSIFSPFKYEICIYIWIHVTSINVSMNKTNKWAFTTTITAKIVCANTVIQNRFNRFDQKTSRSIQLTTTANLQWTKLINGLHLFTSIIYLSCYFLIGISNINIDRICCACAWFCVCTRSLSSLCSISDRNVFMHCESHALCEAICLPSEWIIVEHNVSSVYLAKRAICNEVDRRRKFTARERRAK